MTRRIVFPEACPDAALLQRWQDLLGKAPRLVPWLGEMLGRRRQDLHALESAAVEQALWADLSRWLHDFEKLPQYAVSAIATTLHEEPVTPRAQQREERETSPAQDSPEHGFGELQALLGDPAFALAFHCVETRIRPALSPLRERGAETGPGGTAAGEAGPRGAEAAPLGWEAGPRAAEAGPLVAGGPLSAVPEEAWFGLLHASAPQSALLTPDVAVSLVLRTRSTGWARWPAQQRKAALRLFHASAGDLRGPGAARLCAVLPFALPPSAAPEFVATAARARRAFAEACALCGRLAASARTRPGGLASLHVESAPASPEEIAELFRLARDFKHVGGFRKLLDVL